MAAVQPVAARDAGEVPSVARAGIRPWIIMAIACTGQFMVVLDTAIVNVALPAMRADLALSVSQQQWVVTIYLLTFGGLLLLGARAGDLFGRKAVFQLGLALFSVASLAGGLAVNGPLLLTARAVQGVGAAALAPSSLTVIVAGLRDPRQRAQGIALWGVASSAAAAVGVVLGGLLTEELSWRWVFFINVPVGAGLLVAVGLVLLRGRQSHRGARDLDLPGAVLATLGAGVLIYGFSLAAEQGWQSASVIAALCAAVAFLALLIIVEARAEKPLIRLGIFRIANVRGANIVMLCLGAALTGAIFFLSLYLQDVTGYSALRSGLSLLPLCAVMCFGAPVARRLVMGGVRFVPAAGALITAGAFAWFGWLPVHAAYVSHFLGPSLVMGVGFVLLVVPTVMAATAGVPPHETGLASGLVNVGRQIGGAIGVAALATVASAVTGHTQGTSAPAALLHGYHVALLACAGICLVAVLADIEMELRRA